MQNIKSATECVDTPNHMTSNDTNMAEYFGLRWQISMPMIQLLWHEETVQILSGLACGIGSSTLICRYFPVSKAT